MRRTTESAWHHTGAQRPAAQRPAMGSRGKTAARLASLLLLGLLAAHPRPVVAQDSNQITSIDPESASQGTTGLLVTFTLDNDSPPAPPAGIMPTSVLIGTMAGTSITHASQYIVTAVFDIPEEELPGPKDATIIFPIPGGGTLVFSKPAGFTVTIGGEVPPGILEQPRPQAAPPEGCVTFTISAYGTEPLSYQWQKDGGDLPGATEPSFSIEGVAKVDAGAYRCVVTNDLGSATSDEAPLVVAEPPAAGFPVVDTGQVFCYDNQAEIPCPGEGQPFYGQDGQIEGHAPSYSLSCDGLTVLDMVTGLTWQRSPDANGDGLIEAADKFTLTEAQARPAELNAAAYGGYTDWRLPTIKELYSLIDFRGTDPSGMQGDDPTGLIPFIDTDYFEFAYGQVSAGERLIDSQYASSTLYVGPNQGGEGGKLFGVNFADGRIKGYGLHVFGGDKTFFVQCVRGNTEYGINDFTDNGDGTVTDSATGLMWCQADHGEALTWEEALAWVQDRNAAGYLGHDDWRLPNAKELQSILDYTRAPDAVDPSHRGPACDPLFTCTQIENEACQADYPWYWAGTTHRNFTGAGDTGVYVCFGRALGFMDNAWVDVHGAGAQRTDPKSGSLSDYTFNACGYYNSQAPQGDAIRIYNYVRLVRDAEASTQIGEGGSGSTGPGAGLGLDAVPNPTAGGAVIRFVLPTAGRARLRVVDAGGRQVLDLGDDTSAGGLLAAGIHQVTWKGTDAAGRPLPTGIYFLRLETASGMQSRKLTVLR